MQQKQVSILLSSLMILAGLSACTQNSNPTDAPTVTAAATGSQVRLEQPNLQFPVERQSGNCPTTVGVWEILLPIEGGGEHIVVADIRPARITTSTERSLTYSAPLAEEFATCVGQAIAPEFAAYRFEFRDRQVFFRINPSPQVVATIISKQLASDRPYVFWRAEEGP